MGLLSLQPPFTIIGTTQVDEEERHDVDDELKADMVGGFEVAVLVAASPVRTLAGCGYGFGGGGRGWRMGCDEVETPMFSSPAAHEAQKER